MFGLFYTVFILIHLGSGKIATNDITSDSLIAISDEVPKINEEPEVNSRSPKLQSMNVISNIRNRYARTIVSNKYVNEDKRAQETRFSIVLPDTAFITGFVMEIEGKKYEAYVQEKEQAKKEYEKAISRGASAGHVAISARDSNIFTISVHVEPETTIIFNLTYEELLIRKHGKYEIVLHLHPGQFIKDLEVDVNINESRPIINIETPVLRMKNEITNNIDNNKYATVTVNRNTVHINFRPTIDQQKAMTKQYRKMFNRDITGLSGQFVVQYDVERDPMGGEVLIDDGYFVHFFAPTKLKPIPKYVVFVLDVSSSMSGTKIQQLKEAMNIILGKLRSNDYFTLVKFEDSPYVLNKNNWEVIENPFIAIYPQATEATDINIKNAQEIVNKMEIMGGTNIFDALIVALKLTKKEVPIYNKTIKYIPQPLVFFLTDGEPTVGKTNTEKIIQMIEKRNAHDSKAAIFSLAFGDDTNETFLKKLSIKNYGFMKKIYEASDAALQLQDFYEQISSPLLTNVTFKYSDENVKNITKYKYDIMFEGSEIVVAGKIDNEIDKFVSVEATTLNGIHEFTPSLSVLPVLQEKEKYGHLERLWAYLTIKQLLNKKYEHAPGSKLENGETPEKQALKLALKYSFVTPVTSLVVVKPNESEIDSIEVERLHYVEDTSMNLYDSASIKLEYNLYIIFAIYPLICYIL